MGILDRLLAQGSRFVEAVQVGISAAVAARAERRGTERPSASVVKQLSTNVPTKWTAEKVRQALQLHEQGDFSQSAVLADAMARDDRIGACTNTRVNAIAGKNGLDFAIVPPDGRSQRLAKQVTQWWQGVVTDAVLRALTKDMVLLGVAIARLHWKTTETEWKIERVERWHLSNVHWDEWRERFVTSSATGGMIVIEPGDPNWLVITPAGDQSWMAGAVRALGLPFVFRSMNWRDWANYNERHGQPIITVKEPPTNNQAHAAGFYKQLQNMGQKAIIRLPQNGAGVGFDIGLLEPKDRAFETFTKFRSDLDVGIAVYLLGQNLTTEVGGGSLAAANVHERVRNDYLAADTEGLSTPLRDQVISPWCMFNVRGFQPEHAPWPTWDTSLPDDLKGDAETLNVLGDAVTKLETAGFPIDGDELAVRFKLPLRKGERYKAPVIDTTAEPVDPVPGDDTTSNDS